jgi:hypothetical protein
MVIQRPQITQQRFAVLARQMYDDPKLTGDVLYFALALAEALTRPEGVGKAGWTTELGQRVGGRGGEWARSAIRQDMPRHVPVGDGYTCIGEMIRRPGPCGQPSTRRHWLRDALTGEITVVGSCGRHHAPIEVMERISARAWVDAGKRPGPQNAGGELERYFTANWDKAYTWASPMWTRPGTVLEPPRRPNLTLIRGGLELVDEG